MSPCSGFCPASFIYTSWTKLILVLEGDFKHVPVKDNPYVLCRESFPFVPYLPILEEDLPYPQ